MHCNINVELSVSDAVSTEIHLVIGVKTKGEAIIVRF
jgi:hypothetical protein